MAQVPLNHFARTSAALTSTLTQVYSAPVDTAAIMLTILASNLTNQAQTVTLAVSGLGSIDSNVPEKPYFEIVKDFPLAPNDVTNIGVGKVVLEHYDAIFARSSTAVHGISSINLSLSILETLNTTTIND